MGTIEQGVKQAVENCLKVRPGENALIITDKRTVEIGSALKAAIEKIARRTQFFLMEDFGQRPIDFPQPIDDAVKLTQASIYAAQGAEGELQTFRMPMLGHRGQPRPQTRPHDRDHAADYVRRHVQ